MGIFDYQGTPGNATVQGSPQNPIPMGLGTPAGNAAAGAASGIDPSLLGIFNLITGGLSLGSASSDLGYGKEAAGIADPWSGQRGQYQTALNTFMGNPANSPNAALAPLMNLINNPSSITSQPGYQFGMTQALDAVNRGAGASGLLNSGDRLAALQNQGQAYAGSWLDRIFTQDATAAGLGLQAQGQGFNQLANLAGVNAGSPSSAANAFLTGVGARNNALTGGVSGIAAGALGVLPGLINAISQGGGALSNWLQQNFGNFSGGAGNYNPGDFGGANIDPSTGQPWLSGSDLGSGFDWSSIVGGGGGDLSGLFGGGLGP